MNKMNHIRGISLAVGMALVSGCGFSPIYGDGGTQNVASDDLRLVEVLEIKGVPGTERIRQQLASELNDTLRNDGASQYSINIQITENFAAMGIRPDGSASREQYVLEAQYQLKDNSSGDILDEGTVTSRNAYDVVLSDFSNFQAREDSAQRGIKEIARSIALRLGLYFTGRDQ